MFQSTTPFAPKKTGKPPAGAVLRYGSGLDTYCNVTDEADLALPAFGPMEIH